MDLTPFPASEHTLVLFVSQLASRIKPQSIPVYLSAVRALHLSNGYSNPLEHTLRLNQTLRGIQRIHGVTVRQKLAITTKLLLDIKHYINPNSHNDVVMWAAMVTAHFLLLRCGEFTVRQSQQFRSDHHLTLDDVQFRSSPSGKEFLALRLKTSKTDQFRKSHTLFAGHSLKAVCPVCCLQSLFRLYKSTPSSYSTHPLFTLADGTPLTRQAFLDFTSSRLRILGIDPRNYSGHSFRIGGATSAASAGIPDHLIKTIGRWSSDCYQRYIRTPLESVTAISSTLASHSLDSYTYAYTADLV